MIQQLIRRYVEWLLGLFLVFAAAYIVLMFDGRVHQESIIEALNYSAQTVTTVGYGNWVPTRWNFDADSTLHQRVLLMKLLSVPFSLIGAFVFSVTIGLAILWILDRHR
jgi:hypothetical protein